MRAGFVRFVLVGICLSAIGMFAAKNYTSPNIYNAKTYPAHDDHPIEKLAVAADPYDLNDKEDAVFTLNYKEHGYLPILVIVSNDGDEPVALTGMKAQLTTVRRDKLSPASEEDLYRRFSHLTRRGDEPSRNPLPIPLPRRKAKDGVSKEGRLEFDQAMFEAKAVEPHSSQAGFFFFDVEGISQPLAGAHLYITGLKNNDGQELLYFEIPMEKYLSYQPPGTTSRP